MNITIITILNTSLINRIDSQSINNITEDYQLISVSHGKRNATAISLVFTVHNHISIIPSQFTFTSSHDRKGINLKILGQSHRRKKKRYAAQTR